jgi:predicted phosphodiesterase
MDKHELICKLKELTLELGRTPTRSEFTGRVPGGSYHLGKSFGNYSIMLQAAGLETYDERRTGKKITNAIFNRNLEAHLEEYASKAPVTPLIAPEPPYPKIASISDIHWPFPNKQVIERFYARLEILQPEYVILNGDAWDMYSHSKFPRSHNLFTPREEHQMAREMNEGFWAEVKRRAPDASCVQMLGNHDIRPMKRVMEAYPAVEDWIERMLQETFKFDGVKTIFDPREELILGSIAIFHGYRTQLGAHRDYTLMNCINGHTHLGGTVFKQIRGQTLWELNSGFAGDPLAKGLTYTAQKLSHWTPGHGEVDAAGPRFIPYRAG